jgi:hypothetical protein
MPLFSEELKCPTIQIQNLFLQVFVFNKLLREKKTYIQEALYHALLSAPGAGQVGKTAVPLHQPGQPEIIGRGNRDKGRHFKSLKKSSKGESRRCPCYPCAFGCNLKR